MRAKLFLILGIVLFSAGAYSQNKKPVSFKVLNKDNSFISFSLGMGANYGNNPSLIEFMEGDIDFYETALPDQQFSTFDVGLEFFSGIELQLAKNVSIKGQYSFLTKSYNLSQFPNYDYSYINHQPYVIINYIIPDDHSFIKLGGGVGYIISDFTAKRFGSENKYSSNGVGLMGEALLNLQISSNVGGYISGYMFKTFMGDLEAPTGALLLNDNGGTVNLSSFGVGLRLGMEIFIF